MMLSVEIRNGGKYQINDLMLDFKRRFDMQRLRMCMNGWVDRQTRCVMVRFMRRSMEL